MSTQFPVRAAGALLTSILAAAPVHAQSGAADAQATVPETRYRPAHLHPAPSAPAATPDRTWQENNRIVAGQEASHAGHPNHASHANHAQPAQPAPQAGNKTEPKADPHAGHAGQGHDVHHGEHH